MPTTDKNSERWLHAAAQTGLGFTRAFLGCVWHPMQMCCWQHCKNQWQKSRGPRHAQLPGGLVPRVGNSCDCADTAPCSGGFGRPWAAPWDPTAAPRMGNIMEGSCGKHLPRSQELTPGPREPPDHYSPHHAGKYHRCLLDWAEWFECQHALIQTQQSAGKQQGRRQDFFSLFLHFAASLLSVAPCSL